LGRELAVAALQPSGPAIHRYESPENEDLGDAGLNELLTFLQTEEGRKWAKDHGLEPAKLVQQIQADRSKRPAARSSPARGASETKGQSRTFA
jgi:hypothetical protein